MSARRIAHPGVPGIILIDDGPSHARVKNAGPRGSALRDAIPPVLTGTGDFRWKGAEKPKVTEK